MRWRAGLNASEDQKAAFVDGQLGFGYNQYNESRRLDAFASTATARFGGRQYLAKATVGYDVATQNLVVTPLAGLRPLANPPSATRPRGYGGWSAVPRRSGRRPWPRSVPPRRPPC